MWCKVPQIRLRVLQFKIRFRSLQFKFLLRFQQSGTSSRSHAGWSNLPVQPPPQPVPIQPAPAGMVVAASQIIYQNWIGKKPEFSGKPEEDAESHLLSTRDWMEAHNFAEGEKVRHFCIMLIGEARLWYELLAPLDDDWPALQNKFRWQYSKIGNTPKPTVPCLEDIQI